MKILLANFTKMVNDTGGLAKMTCEFANNMVSRGHEVIVLYSDPNKGDFFYPIDKSVKLYNIRENKNGDIIKYPLYMKIKRELLRVFNRKNSRVINSNFDEIYLLNRIREIYNNIKPDIIVTYQPSSNKTFLLDLKVNIPVINMSHGDPEDCFYSCADSEVESFKYSTVWQVLMPSYIDHIKKYLPEANVICIGNPVPQYDEQADLLKEKDTYKICCVGRFTKKIKRPHILIEAFGRIAKKYPNWTVEFWGEIESPIYEKYLKELIKKYNLQKQVFFKGRSKNVKKVLLDADIFAFPSSAEGFSLALSEAMSSGLAVIGFKHASGVNELINHNYNGILCDEGIDSFSNGLKFLMDNKDNRVMFGKKAKLDMSRFSPELIWDTWENLLESVLSKKRV